MGKKSTVWKLLLYVKSISPGVSMVICTSIANMFVIRLNILLVADPKASIR